MVPKLAMPVKLGIGVTTLNRCRKLETCISQLQRLTPQPFSLVIADDGSEDETVATCAQQQIACVTGKNMGIAWNKNRALFFLHRILECDVIILIEDDSYPNNLGWQTDWIEGAQKWGHVNFAGSWFRERTLSGTGNIDSPFLSASLSGQCAAFSRQALSVCGFMDSRFKSYGYEHAEHSSRLVRAGFGGEMRMTERGELEPHYFLLAADLTVSSNESYRNEESLAFNWIAWTKMYGDPIYRHPWRTREDFLRFRGEIKAASRCTNFSPARRLILEAKWARWCWASRPLRSS
jgi:glycosyltransferase involved in cell wall biosynthesis